jgi:hypothetical protein
MAFWSKYPQPARLYQFLNLFSDMDVRKKRILTITFNRFPHTLLQAKEILHFNQSDLNGSEFDVFLLDTQTGAQYLWTPRQASDKMMQLATQIGKVRQKRDGLESDLSFAKRVYYVCRNTMSTQRKCVIVLLQSS